MIVHLNGKLVERGEARISPFDRGFLFGDGVYEGLRAVAEGVGRGGGAGTRIVGLKLHIERMKAGLDAAGIRWDPSRLGELSEALLRANGMRDAFVYWQVTRGEPAPGEPVRARVPGKGCVPTVFGYCSPQPPLDQFEREGAPARAAITVRDIRWELGRLKSIALMGNVISALKAEASACDEAIFVRSGVGEDEARGGGVVTEGLATNVVLVLPGRGGADELVTPSLDSAPMLAGVTRAILLRLAPEIVQRRVEATELDRAKEIMVVGTTTMVASVTKLNGRAVGDGRIGAVSRRLLALLISAVRSGRDQDM